MKSRTLYCDQTVFKKAMTRFAPAWGLYTICLLLGMLLMRQDNSLFWFHENLSQLIRIMSVINLCYALLAAQLIFGDLYNSRMCNAIHALPVTRDCLFLSHTLAGVTWSVVPTIAATLLALVLGIGSEVENGWQIPLYWLLGTNLQYLFFFGLAAFSALCVGNRFAQAVVYGIINFASVIVYWLVDTLYTPLLYGLQTTSDPFLWFSPAVWFANSDYLQVSRDVQDGVTVRAWFEVSGGWGYLAICAVLGVGLLVAALALYRRRNLESAGDFMAVKALEPVFLVVYPLIVAAVFYYFCDEMINIGATAIVYMAAGLTIGFFTGLMLLEKNIRVFGKKAFLKFAALAVGFGITLLITVLDPLGIAAWIPDAEDVAYVDVTPSRSTAYNYYNSVILDAPEDIAGIIRVHELALEEEYENGGYWPTVEISSGEEHYANVQSVSLHYHLKNGTVRSRYYFVDLRGEAGDILIPFFNRPEAIFWNYEGDKTFEGILKATQNIGVHCARYDGVEEKDATDVSSSNYVTILDRDMIRELLEAIAADCELGVMAQNYNFRPDPNMGSTYWLDLDMGQQSDSITIYGDCVNTNTWLTEHGFISEAAEYMGGLTAYYETK